MQIKDAHEERRCYVEKKHVIVRERKFRGKRLDNGEWVYGSYVVGEETGDNGGVEVYYRETITKLHYIAGENSKYTYLVDPETVGQYIGIPDKNGTPIYEGDKVTSTDYPFQAKGKRTYDGIVGWCSEECCFDIELKLVDNSRRGISDGIAQNISCYDTSKFEVVGNIHEEEGK